MDFHWNPTLSIFGRSLLSLRGQQKIYKSSGYENETELAKVSIALAAASTEREEIIDILNKIEGIALNKKLIVINSVIEISNLAVGVIYYLNMQSFHVSFLCWWFMLFWMLQVKWLCNVYNQTNKMSKNRIKFLQRKSPGAGCYSTWKLKFAVICTKYSFRAMSWPWSRPWGKS